MRVTWRHILRLAEYQTIRGEFKPRPDRQCCACGHKFPLEAEDTDDHYFVAFDTDGGRQLGGVWWCRRCWQTPGKVPIIVREALATIDADGGELHTVRHFGVLLGVWDNNCAPMEQTVESP
jgi:hypothetical protein